MANEPVLIITGASSGIGAASARAAAADGYRLVLAARREAELEQLANELGGKERAIAVPCDVSEWDQVENLAEPPSTPSAASTPSSPTPASAPHAAFSRNRPSNGGRWC